MAEVLGRRAVNRALLERGVARLLHIFRLAVDADPAPVLPQLVAELGGENDLLAPALNSFDDELFVG
jgi:hypothetical protein